jgi:hypothetical protein
MVTVRKDEARNIPMERQIPRFVTAPIVKGQELGKLIVEIE